MKSNDRTQTLANNFLKECNIDDLFVRDKDGQKILVIHLLTDFYRYVYQH